MTKVEELREILLSHLGAEGRDERWCVEEADAIIAASHASGVAEGAAILHGPGVYVGHVINGVMFMPPHKPDGYVWIVPKADGKWENGPASLLAPDKESAK
jgi:hypothetical protein